MTNKPKGQIDELVQKLISLIPEGAKTLPKDIETHFKSALQNGLDKLNLVSRKEFDEQVEVLQRTRKKLEALEKELKMFETKTQSQKKTKK